MNRYLRQMTLLLLLLVPGTLPAAASSTIDGPYIYQQDGQRQQLRLERDASGAVLARRGTLPSAEVEVQTDEATPRRFKVTLRDNYPRADLSVPMPARMLVASDFEGDIEAFVTLMQANGVLDGNLHWSFGKGRLVLVGDMADRGSNVLPLLWLIYRMETEAQAAGGGVHYVLGNHDQMLLIGRTTYLAPKYHQTLALSGQSHEALWDERSELGRWLRSKPILLKVGDYLFMHGGISPEVLALKPTLAEVDAAAARALTDDPGTLADERARTFIWGRQGLLWYRGLAMDRPGSPKEPAEHVRQVLRHFDVEHVVIGHSLATRIGHDYGGAVLRVDVDHAAGTREALLVKGNRLWRVDTSGRRSALAQAVNLD